MTTDLTTAPEHARNLLDHRLPRRDIEFIAAVKVAARRAVTDRTITGAEAARRAQDLLNYATDLTSRMTHHRYMAGEHLRSLWPDAPTDAWHAAMDAETTRRETKAKHLREAAAVYTDALILA